MQQHILGIVAGMGLTLACLDLYYDKSDGMGILVAFLSLGVISVAAGLRGVKHKA